MLAAGFTVVDTTTYRFCVSLLNHFDILMLVMHVRLYTDDACHT